MLDAVILSDIHLGSGNCQARNVCHLLERILAGDLATSQLILNGDVFDSLDFRHMGKNQWEVLSLLRKLSSQIDVLCLRGNHDSSAEIMSHLLGVTVVDEYILESGPERILILHGHIFDRFIVNHPILTWLADCVYFFLQRLDRGHRFAKLAKHGSKTFLRCAQQVEDGAVELARRKDCTIVCCGHTHAAVEHAEQPIVYFNGGCWTELPCNYLTVFDGVVQLHTFHPERVVSEQRRLAVA